MTTDGHGHPTLAAAAAAALAHADIPGNRATVKGAGLAPEETRLYWSIVLAFPELGGPPDAGWVRARATELGVDAEVALAEFATRDLLHRDPASGAITAAYPFSGVATHHQVVPAGGKPVYAMCAIDALGIPFMLGRDATVSAADIADGTPIRVEVRDGQASWDPPGAVVLVGTVGGSGASADTRCPFVNFFASTTAAEVYLRTHPAVSGRVLDLGAALEAGKRVFGTDGILSAYVERGEACGEPCCEDEAAS
jgi:hypothetical protein